MTEVCYNMRQTNVPIGEPLVVQEGAKMSVVLKTHPKALPPMDFNTPQNLHSNKTERVALPEPPQKSVDQVVITSLIEEYWQDSDGWNYCGTFSLPIDVMQNKKIRVRVKRSIDDNLSFVWLEGLDREHSAWNILRDIPSQLMRHASQFSPNINRYEFSKVGEPLVQAEVRDMLNHAAALFAD
jgi:hypothetical protein